MGKEDLSDLFGEPSTPAAPSTTKKGTTMAKADPKVLKPKASAAKAAAPAKAPAKPAGKAAAPAKAAKPAGKPTAPAKPKANGTGKFYFDPDDKAKLVTKLAGIKAKATTKELAAKLGVPTWQVRLAAVAAAADKKVKLTKEGSTMSVSPK